MSFYSSKRGLLMNQKNIAMTAILVSVILLVTPFLTCKVFAATTSTFGYSQIGHYTDQLIPGYKDSCRYQAPQSGTINSVSLYIQTANAQVRFGVYSDQNGKPSQLLAQSNQVTSASNTWVTASLTASIVAGQYYWLTITTTKAIYYYYDYASGGSSGYATEPTTTMSSNYGSYNAWYASKFTMYATYTTTSSPNSTPAPTQTPTASQSSTPTTTYSGKNLESIPSAFQTEINRWSYITLDYSVTHNGNPSIRLAPDNSGRGTRECDGTWINVLPGDHIVFSAWIKTTAYSNTQYTGGRIGIDLYGRTSWGTQTVTVVDTLPRDYTTVNGVSCSGSKTRGFTGTAPNLGNPPVSQFKVPWGKDWTYVYYDFKIPTTYYTQNTGGKSLPAQTQVIGIIPWLNAIGVYDNAYAYFADVQLYVNP